MPIEIAGIKLNRVHRVVTLEQAALVYHYIPGLEGNVAQDLGRDSVRLQIEGIFYGPKAKEELGKLRDVYKKRQPVDILAEIIGQAYFGQVTLERFEVFQLAAEPDQFSYMLIVAEYVKPPKPATTAGPSSVDQAIAQQALDFMDMAALPDALTLGQIPELTNPAEPLSQALGEVTAAAEGLTAVSEGLTALFGLQAEAPEEKLELPEDWGAAPELEWVTPAPLPAEKIAPDEQLFGPNGEALGPDGRPQTTSVNGLKVALDAQGRPLAGKNGELIGADGQPARDSSSRPIGADGQPLLTPWLAIELVDEAGQPLVGASYVINQDDTVVHKGSLDQQGRARIDFLETGPYSLAFPDFDGGDWELTIAPAIEERPPEVAAKTAWLALALIGEDGQPAAAARYIVSRDDQVVREGTLDEQGQVHIQDLESGTYLLAFPDFDAADWGPAETPPVDEGPSPEPGPEAPTQPGEVTPETATRTAWLTIELVSEDGQPAVGARYTLNRADEIVSEGVLDEQGQARLTTLEGGRYSITFLDLDARDWALTEAAAEVEAPIEPEEEPTEAEAPTAATTTSWLTIELLDEEGQPLAGAAYTVSRNNRVVREGRLDEQGQARIEGLEAGRYSLTFPDFDAGDWDSAETPPTGEGPSPEPGPVAPTKPGEVLPEVAAKSAWLRIELVGEDSRPAAGARYIISRGDEIISEGALDGQGQAQIKDLEAGSYSLSFADYNVGDWAPDVAAAPEAPSKPVERAPEVAARTAWLSIELVDEEGQPVAGARYIVSRGEAIIREGTLDSQGQARIEELEAGMYSLTFPDFDTGDWGISSTQEIGD